MHWLWIQSDDSDLSKDFFKDQDVYLSFGGIDFDLNSIIIGCITMVFVFITMGSFFFAIVAGMVGACAPSFYRSYKADQVRKKFERDLPRTVDQLARRLRSGKSFEEAIEETAADAPSGTRIHLNQMAKELKLNAPLDEVLKNAAKRADSDAFDSVVVSLMVARRRGGDIQKTLTKLSGALREIIRLQEKLRTATTDGKRTVIAIALVPFIVIFVIMSGSPELMELMTSRVAGYVMLLIAIVLYILGLFFLQGILKTKI